MDEIKAGAVVQLKSGGPEMTVNFVENDGGGEVAACSWFIKDKRQDSRFAVTSLKLVSPSH